MKTTKQLIESLEKVTGRKVSLKEFKTSPHPENSQEGALFYIDQHIANQYGDLMLQNHKIQVIPDKLKVVNGNLHLERSDVKKLPDNFTVNKSMTVSDTSLSTLPNNLTVGGDLYFNNTPIKTLPNNLKVGGDLYCSNSHLESLPDSLAVGGTIYCGGSPLSKNTELVKKYSQKYKFSTQQ